MKDTSINYTQLGFDSFGLSNIQSASQIPANLADYILEVAENSVSNKKIRSVSADKITAGTLVAVTNIGDESIKLDGEDHSIKIYDASNRLQIYIQGQ
jgi:hypothetical protein